MHAEVDREEEDDRDGDEFLGPIVHQPRRDLEAGKGCAPRDTGPVAAKSVVDAHVGQCSALPQQWGTRPPRRPFVRLRHWPADAPRMLTGIEGGPPYCDDV